MCLEGTYLSFDIIKYIKLERLTKLNNAFKKIALVFIL